MHYGNTALKTGSIINGAVSMVWQLGKRIITAKI